MKIIYSHGLNHEPVSISTEGKGDQGDQNPSEKLYGTNGTQADLVIGHKETKRKKGIPEKIKHERGDRCQWE